MKSEETIEARIAALEKVAHALSDLRPAIAAELEKLLGGKVTAFDTNIRVDGVPKPVRLLVIDKTGTLAPPKLNPPTFPFSVVRDEN